MGTGAAHRRARDIQARAVITEFVEQTETVGLGEASRGRAIAGLAGRVTVPTEFFGISTV